MMPTPRDHIAVAVMGGKVYVFGGRRENFARNLDSSEAYDVAADRWQPLAALHYE